MGEENIKICRKCKQEMNISAGVEINFLILSKRKMCECDDRVIMVCSNEQCDLYGLLQVSIE